MNLCLACHAAEPVETLSPFCSVECLNADPRQSKSPVLQRMLAAFDDRDTGAGGPGGMVPTGADERLRWYLSGALDARATHSDWRQEALRHLAQMLDIASKHVMIPQRKAAEDFLTEARGADHPCTDLEAAARLSELRATESLAMCRSSFCSVAPDPHPRTGSCPPSEIPELEGASETEGEA